MDFLVIVHFLSRTYARVSFRVLPCRRRGLGSFLPKKHFIMSKNLYTMQSIHYIVVRMNPHTTSTCSIIAASVILIVVSIDMVTAFGMSSSLIAVDPTGIVTVGETLSLSGTTNLPEGTSLIVEIYPVAYEEETGQTCGVFSGVIGTVDVTGRNPGTWSMTCDTSSFSPVIYMIRVYPSGQVPEGNRTVSPAIVGQARLVVRDKALPALQGDTPVKPSHYIRIDPVGAIHAGVKFTLTGRTNYPAGTGFLVQVEPVSFEPAPSAGNATGEMRGQFSGVLGTVDVTPGPGGLNSWSMALDTSDLLPSEYTIMVSEFNGTPGLPASPEGIIHETTQFFVE